MSRMLRGLISLLLVILLIGVGWWLWKAANPTPVLQDNIDVFLEQHWKRPLPLQGTPPAHFSSIEASLAPASCAQCHAGQYRDWRTSLHSRSMGNGIMWQARALSPADVAGCLNCHAPLAEQKVLLGKELGWPDAPSGNAPGYVAQNLHQQGLVCAACHVRAHKRYGPPAAAGKSPGDSPGLPHGGFQEAVAFADSRFCASCHQFPANGPALNGKLLENTHAEWQASRHASEGRTCQSCHMPERRHLWRGIHDPDMVRQALTTHLSLKPVENGRLQVRAEIRNTGAGHYFPTYLVPKVWLRLIVVDANGVEQSQLSESLVSRETNVWLNTEYSDTRLAPDELRVLEAELTMPTEAGRQIELRIDVAPSEHYERMYSSVLANSSAQLDSVAHGILEKALAEVRANRYSVVSARHALPSAIAN